MLAVADASALPGLRRALPAGSIELVATASTQLRALAELQRVCPDVVVLDLSLTQTDVFQLLTQLVQDRNAPVLALTSGPDAARQAERAWDAGASDVLERPSDDSSSAHALTLRIVALAAGQRQRTSRPRTSLSEKSRGDPPLSAAGEGKLELQLPAAGRAKADASLGPPQSSKSPPKADVPHIFRGAAKVESPLPAAPLSRAPSRPGSPLPAATSGPRSSRPSAPQATSLASKSAWPPACLLAIGASTGGTLALTELLRALPASTVPVLVVQHMLPEFTQDFAERLNEACAMQVREARDGEVIAAGQVRIAPGGRHLRLARDAVGSLYVRVTEEAPVGKHRPSVDVLFRSCAEVLGPACLGVLLTGMGDDGARGLLALHNTGARTLVQDQASSACFGMPSAAIALGAARQVLSLRDIAHALRELTP